MPPCYSFELRIKYCQPNLRHSISLCILYIILRDFLIKQMERQNIQSVSKSLWYNNRERMCYGALIALTNRLRVSCVRKIVLHFLILMNPWRWQCVFTIFRNVWQKNIIARCLIFFRCLTQEDPRAHFILMQCSNIICFESLRIFCRFVIIRRIAVLSPCIARYSLSTLFIH